ncbi:MAG: hypothetical protein COX70_00005, partial [Flavobacteriales bacterium CG_4_10_14_0_2_um_filter_32_8]
MKIFASFKNNIILYLFLVLVFLAACGNNVIKEENSTNKIIKEYYITCDTNDFSSLYTNYQENKYIPIKITLNGESRTARMRVRGDTSRKESKKSLKIKLDSLLFNNVP